MCSPWKTCGAKLGTVETPIIAIIAKITSGLFLGIASTIDINLKKFDGNLNINGTIIKLALASFKLGKKLTYV